MVSPSVHKPFSTVCYKYITHSVMLKMPNTHNCFYAAPIYILVFCLSLKPFNPSANGSTQDEHFKAGYTDHIMCSFTGSNPAGQKKIFPSQKRPDQLWAHPASYSKHTEVLPLNDRKPSGNGYTGSRSHMGRFIIILHLLFS